MTRSYLFPFQRADAENICKQPFKNADTLGTAVQELQKLLRRQWYEKVTDDEIAEIKKAIVSGAGGIATHPGHWYDCVSVHPVSIRSTPFPLCLLPSTFFPLPTQGQ